MNLITLALMLAAADGATSSSTSGQRKLQEAADCAKNRMMDVRKTPEMRVQWVKDACAGITCTDADRAALTKLAEGLHFTWLLKDCKPWRLGMSPDPDSGWEKCGVRKGTAVVMVGDRKPETLGDIPLIIRGCHTGTPKVGVEQLKGMDDLMQVSQAKPGAGTTFMPSFAEGKPNGVKVYNLKTDDPLVACGIQRGDIVTDADGVPVRKADDIGRLNEACTAQRPIKVVRAGNPIELNPPH